MNELFLCDVQDMEMPIGFEMLADIYGLNVSYETQEDQSAGLFDKTSHGGTSTVKGSQATTSKRVTMADGTASDMAPQTSQLQRLNFPNCMINKASSQKFILKNLSGIKTTFLFDVTNYAPLQQVAPKEKTELEKARE